MPDEKVENSPAVSVITVTFNAAATLRPTMESVAGQKARDYEHIVMDGASTDTTLSLVDQLKNQRTRVFSSPDRGIYDAMNKALKIAKGNFVIFLNAGDRFASSDTLQQYIDACSSNETPDIVYGQTVLVDKDDNILGPRHLMAPRELTYKSFKDGMVVCHQAFMVRRAIAPEYDLKYRFSSDYDWCLKCLKRSRNNKYLGDQPAIHYLSEGMTTANHKASLRERFDIMCRNFGVIATVVRHLKFLTRYLNRRRHSVNNQ